MGREISKSRFTAHDFSSFAERLRQETKLLGEMLRYERMDSGGIVAGFELEAWLVDELGRPKPDNAALLSKLDQRLACAELAQFNIELNGTPQALHGAVLRRLHDEFLHTWRGCQMIAESIGVELAMIGILPSVSPEQLDLSHMSDQVRYRALNEQVLALRAGQPARLDIHGRQSLSMTHYDVMLEAAATSFQIHLQVPSGQAARTFNCASIISAPMVAIAANSPYLFGRDLWDETRIALFEQAIDVGTEPYRRVSFGSGYTHGSLIECFEENLDHFPTLLPMLFDEAPEDLAHLRLHNGTIWRWNRPLVGFNGDKPHLRIEHRVVPSGPSVSDCIANAGFFYGLVKALVELPEPPEQRLDFAIARRNFYEAARHGLRAEIRWFDDVTLPIHRLLCDELVPLAREGLTALNVDAADIDTFIGIIEARLTTGQNGAAWQRQWVARHGHDMNQLTKAYMARQETDSPVHTWDLEGH
jgi:gamma-glutamyl:cysteine ligase YbdK (ATP-grasp superfamily)